MVPAAVESAIAVEINQIDQQLAADATTETARMPAMRPRPRRHHRHVSPRHRLAALSFRKIKIYISFIHLIYLFDYDLIMI